MLNKCTYMKLSIVVPCYNEEKNLPLILEGFSRVINRSDIEVILVDNGSYDDTAQILQELAPLYPFLKIVRIKKNQGYGFGILGGLKQATGEYLGWTHGDMQTSPSDVIRAIEIIEKQNNSKDVYIKGVRKGRPLFDVFFTMGMSIFETILLQEKLFDINAQPNIFHRSFYERWSNPPWDFSFDLFVLYLARKMGLDIIRFDVAFIERINGESHWNNGLLSKWKFIKRTLCCSLKLRKSLKLRN